VHHTRVLRPAEGVYAFYDGRIHGYRYAEAQNWVDEGALGLGIASFAIVGGDEALVYDTHVSVEHARFIRDALERDGVRAITVVLSHWHLDHVAGTTVFDDCEVIANERTAQQLDDHREAIEAGTQAGPPGIDPLVLPTRTFADRLSLDVGGTAVELIHANIHSDDATVLWLPAQRLLFAGDTLEDTVTYVGDPGRLDEHLTELDRLAGLAPDRILPNHGDPDVIAAGGYPLGLITATQEYIRILQRARDEPQLREAGLRELLAGPLEAGWIRYFAPYEEVHRANVEQVVAAR
jgi:cyclase